MMTFCAPTRRFSLGLLFLVLSLLFNGQALGFLPSPECPFQRENSGLKLPFHLNEDGQVVMLPSDLVEYTGSKNIEIKKGENNTTVVDWEAVSRNVFRRDPKKATYLKHKMILRRNPDGKLSGYSIYINPRSKDGVTTGRSTVQEDFFYDAKGNCHRDQSLLFKGFSKREKPLLMYDARFCRKLHKALRDSGIKVPVVQNEDGTTGYEYDFGAHNKCKDLIRGTQKAFESMAGPNQVTLYKKSGKSVQRQALTMLSGLPERGLDESKVRAIEAAGQSIQLLIEAMSACPVFPVPDAVTAANSSSTTNSSGRSSQ